MRAASRAASVAVRTSKRPVIEGTESAAGLHSLAEDVYAMADVLVGAPRLRRMLGDPATDADGRTGLVASVFGGKVSEGAMTIGQGIVRERWSSPWDMTDAFEIAGDDALFEAAMRSDSLDEVVDELFRFERILDVNSDLTALLDETIVEPARLVKLLDDVLAGRTDAVTHALLVHSVRSQRKPSITLAIDDLLDEASRRQAETMARVLAAVELPAEQRRRLAAALSELYGRRISVRTAVVPGVLGGLIIRVGDEVIDGSVESRLVDARSNMTGGATASDVTTRTRQGKN